VRRLAYWKEKEMTGATPILFDFESRSRADLKAIGGRRYWEHASTEALCAAWFDTRTGDVGIWRRGEPPPFTPDRQLGAHNWSGFDRFGAIRMGWVDATHEGIDTSELARRAGFRGGLDAIGDFLGYPKDKAASKFTKALSSIRRPSGKNNPDAISAADWKSLDEEDRRALGVQPELTPAVLERVEDYCFSDVEIMAHGWDMLSPMLDEEPDVLAVDRIVNDRGVYFDRDLAEALLLCDAHLGNTVIDDIAAATGKSSSWLRAAANSPKQFCAATGCDNAQKETIEEILVNHGRHPPFTVALATVRDALASAASGKLRAGLARLSLESTLQDSFVYVKAHTWRWAGQGFQMHNMVRPTKRFEKWEDGQIDRLACEVAAGDHLADADEINLLLRATVRARPGHTLVVEDYSGVEARALAWVSDDQKALEVFASGQNPYIVMASTIFGVPYESIVKGSHEYSVGKAAVLACGYQMGPDKFDFTARKGGVDLAAIGVDPAEVVDAWRKLHAPSVRFWSDTENAIRAAINGEATELACFTVTPASDDSGDVAVFMPSGRPLIYREARLVSGGKSRRGTQICFTGGKTGTEYTYGGKLVENLIQALCRDMLAHSLVGAERAGLRPVMHVHDEIVCEVPERAGAEGLAELHQIMVTLPDWAEGFPVGAAGFHGKRYRK
jgi:DNA polymerase